MTNLSPAAAAAILKKPPMQRYVPPAPHAPVKGTHAPLFRYSACKQYRVYDSHDAMLCNIYNSVKNGLLHYPKIQCKNYDIRDNGFGRGRGFSFTVKEHWLQGDQRFTSDKVLNIQAGHRGVYKDDSLAFKNQILICDDHARGQVIIDKIRPLALFNYDYDKNGCFLLDDWDFCDQAAAISNEIQAALGITYLDWKHDKESS